MVRDEEDKPLLRRECDHCDKFAALETEVGNLRGWVSSLAKKFDIVTGFGVLILLGVIGNLILHFLDKPDATAIASAVATALKNGGH